MKNEIELKNILKNFNGFTVDMLYNDLIIIPNKSSDFNNEEYNKFLIAFSLFNNNSINPANIDASTFRNYCSNVSRINPEKLKKMKDNLLKLDWIGFTANRELASENKMKLYLSVDNSDIHSFTISFLQACLDKEFFDYDFKVNNKSSINRRDNIVIYCNENNIGKYVSVVQEILSQKSNIKFNSSHLLAIPYDEHIYCGVDFNNGEVSYTDQICKNIFKALNEGYSPKQISEAIDYKKAKNGPNIFSLIDATKKKK